MNRGLVVELEHIEREKGIKKEILLEAVESAMASAVRKNIGDKMAEVEVKIDPETGDFKVKVNGKKADVMEFGRIAAQTAKQVIIQKIREAEREVIFNDYSDRVGSLVTGTVHRTESSNTVIIDLGKTEGVLPRREQSPKEEYKQGERIRAFVLDVKPTPRGPQIILSRTATGMVKELFKFEVPEISENIVEIKGISREPGDRSKVAVYSKDEKVDAVGACVGMRGTRVKNIVRELHGEKIDIIRWSDDITEFAGAALSPAEVSSIKVDKENKKLNVLVADDQLSLAIGKKGQNVRLAAKLIGWDIDIKSAKEAAQAKDEVGDIDGVGSKMKDELISAGFDSLAKIAAAKPTELMKVKGVGPKSAGKVIKGAKELLKDAN